MLRHGNNQVTLDQETEERKEKVRSVVKFLSENHDLAVLKDDNTKPSKYLYLRLRKPTMTCPVRQRTFKTELGTNYKFYLYIDKNDVVKLGCHQIKTPDGVAVYRDFVDRARPPSYEEIVF